MNNSNKIANISFIYLGVAVPITREISLICFLLKGEIMYRIFDVLFVFFNNITLNDRRSNVDLNLSFLQDEFLDVIYWMRQLVGIVVGILWGVLPIKGILGILL